MGQSTTTSTILKITFNILIVFALVFLSFWIIRPFILGMLWALIIVVATWPFIQSLQKYLGNNRLITTTLITLVISAIFICFLVVCVFRIIDSSDEITAWIKYLSTAQIPDLIWLKKIPLVGNEVYDRWEVFMKTEKSNLLTIIQPYLGKAASWGFAQISNVSYLIVHCVIMVIFIFFFYLNAEKLSFHILKIANHLSDKNGIFAVTLAAQSTRAVALGIVITALAQTLIAGTALQLIHVPQAFILTFVIFIFCMAQLGPLFVLIPTIAWLYFTDQFIACIILVVIAIIVSTVDGIIRPILIKKGADLPLSLVVLGVFGGILSFGIIGLFIGPVILAVTHRLMIAWINNESEMLSQTTAIENNADKK